MGSSEVGGETDMSESRRVGVECGQEFSHICQPVVIFGSQRQGVEVIEGRYPYCIKVPPAAQVAALAGL